MNNWKLERINWFKHGNCWTWWSIKRFYYYSGNQVCFIWGRVGLTFERRDWQKSSMEEYP